MSQAVCPYTPSHLVLKEHFVVEAQLALGHTRQENSHLEHTHYLGHHHLQYRSNTAKRESYGLEWMGETNNCQISLFAPRCQHGPGQMKCQQRKQLGVDGCPCINRNFQATV